ncbi:peptidase inhibitor family I36 protein [Streptomyces sp. MBT65]|uniref:peptidase inhibitor family I36 protein n=1 Tax=Streptomyces sp. MBT65 TaxID=1488395 RepID=UPI0027DA834B|nr:peptidase inhibitor family I36 protein [Streptomyces sp. MBT65]
MAPSPQSWVRGPAATAAPAAPSSLAAFKCTSGYFCIYSDWNGGGTRRAATRSVPSSPSKAAARRRAPLRRCPATDRAPLRRCPATDRRESFQPRHQLFREGGGLVLAVAGCGEEVGLNTAYRYRLSVQRGRTSARSM